MAVSINANEASKISSTAPAPATLAPKSAPPKKKPALAPSQPQSRVSAEPSLFSQSINEATQADNAALSRTNSSSNRRPEDDLELEGADTEEVKGGSGAPDNSPRDKAANKDSDILAALSSASQEKPVGAGDVFNMAKSLIKSRAIAHDKFQLETSNDSPDEIGSKLQLQSAENVSRILGSWSSSASSRNIATRVMLASFMNTART